MLKRGYRVKQPVDASVNLWIPEDSGAGRQVQESGDGPVAVALNEEVWNAFRELYHGSETSMDILQFFAAKSTNSQRDKSACAAETSKSAYSSASQLESHSQFCAAVGSA